MKRVTLWPWLTAVVVLVLLVAGLGYALATQDDAVESDLATLAKGDLESEKLRQEVQKLRDEQGAPLFLRPAVVTALTVLLAGVGLIVTLRGQSVADRTQRREMEENRKAEHKQAEETRQEEAERLQEERFAALAKALASDSPGERVSAMVAIESFLAVPDYHDRLFTLLRGILTIPWSATSDRAIARAFVQLLRLRVEADPALSRRLDMEDLCLRDADLTDLGLPELNGRRINLSGACLDGAILDGAILTDANLSGIRGDSVTSLRRADLSGTESNLSEAVLRHSNLTGARFRKAKLSSAKLGGAKCRGAAFGGAGLQEADLRGADLVGADFTGADVHNAFFEGATFNQHTLTSLLRADNWEKANWDDATLAELHRLKPAAP